MVQPPLTHHDILLRLAPFTAAGWRVDLPASDRVRRCLVLVRPPDADASAARCPVKLILLEREPGWYSLTREVDWPAAVDGLPAAAVETHGANPAELLERLQRLAPSVQQEWLPGGIRVAWQQRIEASGQIRLCGAQAAWPGLVLRMNVGGHGRLPADVELLPAGNTALDLPDDLLAVLGGGWALRLTPYAARWRSSLQVSAREPRRSGQLAERFRAACVHLHATLQSAPADYHARHGKARWRVTMLRALPLLGAVLLLGAAVALPGLHLSSTSPWRMIIFNAPPVLLVLAFCARELPRIEWPRRPRPLVQSSWARPARQSAPRVHAAVPGRATRP